MINWRKGLFRFWVISATFWTVGIWVFSFSDYKEVYKKESKLKNMVSEIKNPKKVLLKILEEFPELRKQYELALLSNEELAKIAEVTKEELAKIAGVTLVDPKAKGIISDLAFGPPIDPKEAITYDKYVQNLLGEICKKAENDKKDTLYRILLFSLIPPIILLIMGSAIYWGLRGFRT